MRSMDKWATFNGEDNHDTGSKDRILAYGRKYSLGQVLLPEKIKCKYLI